MEFARVALRRIARRAELDEHDRIFLFDSKIWPFRRSTKPSPREFSFRFQSRLSGESLGTSMPIE